MSSFLDNLKKSVETGTFNSEAANKINEISSAAEKVFSSVKEETIEEVKQAIENGEKDVKGEDISLNKLAEKVEARLEGNKAEPVDAKTALEKNIEAERTMLKWEHEAKMYKYQARILNDLNSVVKGLIELVEVSNDMLQQTNDDDLEFKECCENIIENSSVFLENIYEKDLQIKEFLTTFASKYRKS